MYSIFGEAGKSENETILNYKIKNYIALNIGPLQTVLGPSSALLWSVVKSLRW